MWSAYRFRPGAKFTSDYLRPIDFISAVSLIMTNVLIDKLAIDMIVNGGYGVFDRSFAIAPLAGSAATWLLSIYPLQLAI